MTPYEADNQFYIEDAELRAAMYRDKRLKLEVIEPRTEEIAEHIGQLMLGEEHWNHKATIARKLTNA